MEVRLSQNELITTSFLVPALPAAASFVRTPSNLRLLFTDNLAITIQRDYRDGFITRICRVDSNYMTNPYTFGNSSVSYMFNLPLSQVLQGGDIRRDQIQATIDSAFVGRITQDDAFDWLDLVLKGLSDATGQRSA